MASFSRFDVDERVIDVSHESGIRKTDSVSGLECFCSDNPPNNNFEMNIRGCIFEGKILILKSLPYAFVYKFNGKNPEDEEDDDFTSLYDEEKIGDFSKYKCTLMKEGTVVRIFNHRNVWYITTHRKIDAFKSKWGNVSFGEIFEKFLIQKTRKTLKEFYEILDKDKIYHFLVGTTNTTRIVSPEYSDISLLCCMDKNFKEIKDETMKDWYPKEFKFENLKSAVEFVKQLEFPFDSGFGLYLTSSEKSIKIINVEYEEISSIRHNLPSIPFAYIHNVFDIEKKQQFRQLYKDFTETFDFYDQEIKDILPDLREKYFRRYAKKEDYKLPPNEHNILYHIHGIYLETKQVIQESHIIEALKKVPASNINQIISQRKQKKKFLEKQQSPK